MPALSPFDYAILRVVPHVEREEFVNVGVILFCRARHLLGARIELKPERLLALCPDLDVTQVQAQLDLVPRVVAGGEAARPLDDLNQAERFHWLVAPRSTIVQVSPVHPGLCDDPQAALDDLFERLVS